MKQLTKLSRIILGALLPVSLSMTAYADLYEPVPHCYQPSKPLWFATSYYKQRYDNDVEEYQSCMKAFILKEELAAKMHTKAAKMALESWNDFVKNK